MAINDTEGQSYVISPEPFAPTGVAVLSHTAPHFLLLTQAQSDYQPYSTRISAQGGLWRFVLEEMGGNQRIEVSETEPGVWGERLQLLAVVRGLEALEQPSKVTLITPSRFVGNGIRVNLSRWRENHWQWENFGEMTEIKNVDLWKRIDHTLRFHELDCRVWDFDSSSVTSRQANPHRLSTDGVQANPAHALSIPSHPPIRSNRISFEELRQQREPAQPAGSAQRRESFRVKPIGSGRAFGYYDPAAVSTISFTG